MDLMATRNRYVCIDTPVTAIDVLSNEQRPLCIPHAPQGETVPVTDIRRTWAGAYFLALSASKAIMIV